MASTKVGTLEAELLLEIGQFVRNAKRAQDSANRMGNGFRGIGRIVKGALAFFAAREAVQFGASFVKAASDATEATNLFKKTFGKELPGVRKELAKFAEDTGRSEFELTRMAGTLGALLVPMTGSREQAAGLSTGFAKLATDAASFFNATDTEALEAIRSGLVGQSEPLRRFGVDLTEQALKLDALNLGLGTNIKQLTTSQKVQVRSASITRQLAIANGDAADTSRDLANLTRNIASQFADFRRVIGAELLPVVTVLARKIFDLGKAFLNNIDTLREFVQVGIFNTLRALEFLIVGALRVAQGFQRFRAIISLALAGVVTVIGLNIDAFKLMKLAAQVAFAEIVGATKLLIISLDKLLQPLSLAIDGFNALSGGDFNPLRAAIDTTTEALDKFVDKILEGADETRNSIGKLPEPLQNLQDSFFATANAWLNSADQIGLNTDKVKKLFGDLRNEIGKVKEEASKPVNVPIISPEAIEATKLEIQSVGDILRKTLTDAVTGFSQAVADSFIVLTQTATTNAEQMKAIFESLGQSILRTLISGIVEAATKRLLVWIGLEKAMTAATAAGEASRAAVGKVGATARVKQNAAVAASGAAGSRAGIPIVGPVLAVAAAAAMLAFVLKFLNGFQKGGVVKGPGGVDNVPILATAGEAVLSKDVTNLLRETLGMPKAQLDPFAFQDGGMVSTAGGQSSPAGGGETRIVIETLALPDRARAQRWFRDVFEPVQRESQSRSI